jgi:hypothetical protein
MAVEAQLDEEFAERFREFVARRRGVLTGLLRRGIERGELPGDANLTLLVDVVYGVLWYRVLTGAPVDRTLARDIADLLLDD